MINVDRKPGVKLVTDPTSSPITDQFYREMREVRARWDREADPKSRTPVIRKDV